MGPLFFKKPKCIYHQCLYFWNLVFFFFFKFIYLRERESIEWRRCRKWGRHRIPSRLYTVSTEPDVELELMNREIMTWAEVGRLIDRATQVPWNLVFLTTITSLSNNPGTVIMVENPNRKSAPFPQLNPEILVLEYGVCNHNFQELRITCYLIHLRTLTLPINARAVLRRLLD